MKLSAKINKMLHKLMIKYVCRQYMKINKTFEGFSPQFFKPIDPTLSEKHRKLWGQFGIEPTDRWFRLHSNISGNIDYRFCPEIIYYPVIERCLNNCDIAGASVEDKNDVTFFIPKPYQPKAIIRYVRGVWFDDDMMPITREVAEGLLRDYAADVIGKPATASSGGSSVYCFKNRDGKKIYKDLELTLNWIEKSYQTYIVQERLVQEPQTRAFNPDSLNTCRLVTFRRPWSGKTSVIAGMFRTGITDEVVDNYTAGGVVADIDFKDGSLGDFGVDHFIKKYDVHPSSGLPFKGFKLPYYDAMAKVAVEVAQRIPNFNLLGLDLIARPDGTPCVIEINDSSIAHWHVQHKRPFFVDETEHVIECCKVHRNFDTFRHFRTFY